MRVRSSSPWGQVAALAVLAAVAAVAAVAAPACSYTFDDEQPDVTLVGAPPLLSSFQKLNRAPVSGIDIVEGGDKAYWAVLREQGNQLRLSRLKAPFEEQVLTGANHIYVRYRAFWLLTPAENDHTQTLLTVVRAGQKTAPAPPFLLPPGPEMLIIDDGGSDDIFLYWILKKETTSYLLQHRDRSFSRMLPVPKGIDPTSPYSNGQFYFALGGTALIERDGEGHMIVRSTRDTTGDVDLGKQPSSYFIDDGRRALVAYDDKGGLRTVPLDGSPGRVLDPVTIDASEGVWWDGTIVYYRVGDELRTVSLDTPGAPVVVKRGLKRLLAVERRGKSDPLDYYYSTDPGSRWSNGAGDGWLGDWRFMDRGIDMRVSYDRMRVRWLEHAARAGGIGDLLSATVPGGAPLRLARNVRQFDELRDGRVLAISNHAFTGTQNRLIAIDEKTKTAQWVADQAHEYRYVPGSSDLLVDVVTGATGYDVMRVPLPPPPPGSGTGMMK